MQLDLIGKRLGNYQIEQPLGRGGMAHVYKAMDVTLKRPVAIKVIAPDLTDQDRYQERFEHEAQSIAALDHPHIVPVYYFGKTRAVYYLAMKFIEGETLETLISRYSKEGEFLPSADILRMVEGVATALDYAHSKGVIHRDVKPSNIMLDSSGHAYLTDFGLALNVKQGTMGETFGTPHYIAPEQATSSSAAVPQSDLYSLGVVLYELFTGVVPFDDPSSMAVALHHITQPPPPPRALNPDLAPAIEQVLLKCLEKQPEARYQSGAKLVAALRTALKQSMPKQAAPALPPLPAGVKAPPKRKESNRPVANEVRTILEQRAKPKAINTPPSPIPAAKPAKAAASAPAAKPKAAPKQSRAERPRRSSGVGILLFLLIAAVAGISAFVVMTQNQTPGLLPTLVSPATPLPGEGLAVHFAYNESSFWWVNETDTQMSVNRIRFVNADGTASFVGERWAVIYSRVDAHRCSRLNVRTVKEEDRMPRPESCTRQNVDLISNPDEVFWLNTASFNVYWDDALVATCPGGVGECHAALPVES